MSGGHRRPIAVPGTDPRGRTALVERISPRFFERVGVPLIAGRDFSFADARGATPVAIVDEVAARPLFGETSAIGRHIGITERDRVEEFEIVGVAPAIRRASLREGVQPAVYVALFQGGRPWMPTLYLRADGRAEAHVPSVLKTIQALDGDLPVIDVRTLGQKFIDSLARERLVAALSTFFGVLAALLAAIGLYAVVAYAVARRNREIGVRMALGAPTGRVVWLVMREALVLIAVGVGVGLCVSLSTTRWLSSLLFGLRPADPVSMLLGIILLFAVGAAASYVPARRASRIDPTVALRHE